MEQVEIEKNLREVSEVANLALAGITNAVSSSQDPMWDKCLEWAKKNIQEDEVSFTLFLYAYTQTLRQDGNK